MTQYKSNTTAFELHAYHQQNYGNYLLGDHGSDDMQLHTQPDGSTLTEMSRPLPPDVVDRGGLHLGSTPGLLQSMEESYGHLGLNGIDNDGSPGSHSSTTTEYSMAVQQQFSSPDSLQTVLIHNSPEMNHEMMMFEQVQKEVQNGCSSRPVSPMRGRGRPPGSRNQGSSSVDSGQKHTCDMCGKVFQNNSALLKHKLTHSQERRYVCPVCQKGFKRQDHLTGHLNVHRTVKPFPCVVEDCVRSYCDGRSLKRHLEHAHGFKNPTVSSAKGFVRVRFGENVEEVTKPMNQNHELLPPDSICANDAERRNQSHEAMDGLNSGNEEMATSAVGFLDRRSSEADAQQAPLSANPGSVEEMPRSGSSASLLQQLVRVSNLTSSSGVETTTEQQGRASNTVSVITGAPGCSTSIVEDNSNKLLTPVVSFGQPPPTSYCVTASTANICMIPQTSASVSGANGVGVAMRDAKSPLATQEESSEHVTSAKAGISSLLMSTGGGLSDQRPQLSPQSTASVVQYGMLRAAAQQQPPAPVIQGPTAPHLLPIGDNGVHVDHVTVHGDTTSTTYYMQISTDSASDTASPPLPSAACLPEVIPQQPPPQPQPVRPPHHPTPPLRLGHQASIPRPRRAGNTGPVKCTVCSKEFRNVAALNGHMRLHRANRKDKGFEIQVTDRTGAPVAPNLALPSPQGRPLPPPPQVGHMDLAETRQIHEVRQVAEPTNQGVARGQLISPMSSNHSEHYPSPQQQHMERDPRSVGSVDRSSVVEMDTGNNNGSSNCHAVGQRQPQGSIFPQPEGHQGFAPPPHHHGQEAFQESSVIDGYNNSGSRQSGSVDRGLLLGYHQTALFSQEPDDAGMPACSVEAGGGHQTAGAPIFATVGNPLLGSMLHHAQAAHIQGHGGQEPQSFFGGSRVVVAQSTSGTSGHHQAPCAHAPDDGTCGTDARVSLVEEHAGGTTAQNDGYAHKGHGEGHRVVTSVGDPYAQQLIDGAGMAHLESHLEAGAYLSSGLEEDTEVNSFGLPSELPPMEPSYTTYSEDFYASSNHEESLMSPPAIIPSYQHGQRMTNLCGGNGGQCHGEQDTIDHCDMSQSVDGQLDFDTSTDMSGAERKRHYTTPEERSRRHYTTPAHYQTQLSHPPAALSSSAHGIPPPAPNGRTRVMFSPLCQQVTYRDRGGQIIMYAQQEEISSQVTDGYPSNYIRALQTQRCYSEYANQGPAAVLSVRPPTSSPPKRRKRCKSKPDQQHVYAEIDNEAPSEKSGRHSLPVSPVRFAKLHGKAGQGQRGRPAPFELPTPAPTLSRYHSQLRSPRFRITDKDAMSNSPPPYTPPPILSPVRHGSGLFCTIVPRPLLASTSVSLPATLCGSSSATCLSSMPLVGQPPVSLSTVMIATAQQPTSSVLIGSCLAAPAMSMEGIGAALLSSQPQGPLSPLKGVEGEGGLGSLTVSQAPVPSEPTSLGSPGLASPTDLVPPHINIGPAYQAEIPALLPAETRHSLPSRETLLWSPRCLDELPLIQFSSFMALAQSIAVPGAGRNVELALRLLQMADGSVQEATAALLNPALVFSEALAECRPWSEAEIDAFREGLRKHDKDFFLISQLIPGRSTGECVEFYYLYKKACPEDYREVKKEHRPRRYALSNQIISSYNLRSSVQAARQAAEQQQQQQEEGLEEGFTSSSPSPATLIQRMHDSEQAQHCDSPASVNNGGGLLQSSSGHHSVQQLHQHSAMLQQQQVEDTGGFHMPPYTNNTVTLLSGSNPNGHHQKGGGEEQTMYRCKVCPRAFSKQKSRNAHMKVHSMRGEWISPSKRVLTKLTLD